jgi:hypothetical protein
VLYSNEPSPPNIPVDVQFGLEMPWAGFGWSAEEWYDASRSNTKKLRMDNTMIASSMWTMSRLQLLVKVGQRVGIHCPRCWRSTGRNCSGANLMDLAPTILHLLGLPVQSEMDGRVLTEIMESAGPIRYAEAQPQVSQETGLDAEDGEERLRSLGYP